MIAMHCKIGYLARFVELADKHEVLHVVISNSSVALQYNEN